MKIFNKIIIAFLLIMMGSREMMSQGDPAEVSVNGLGARVTVRRDSRSIPYIEAANDADLYFMQGFTTASDRLWQMDVMRRVASGETSEIFGKAALEEDKAWRRYNFTAVVNESLKTSSPEMKQALESYAAGVNAYIASLGDGELPIEFRILQYKPREWKPADSLLIGKILAQALSSTWRNDLQRAAASNIAADKLTELNNQVTEFDVVLFGKDGKTKAAPARAAVSVSSRELDAADIAGKVLERSLERIGLYAEELAASNNWVLSGKLTADGRAMLANDPHLAANAPGIWYLAHLSVPKYSVAGVSLPGVPGIVLGHNEHFAWGATNVGPDVQDLYLEKFDAQGRYLTPDGWQMPKKRTETFNVRSNPLKTDTTAETMEVIETRNGVIHFEEGDKRYALKWTAMDPKNVEFEAFIAINRSTNWQEFKTALSSYCGPTQNFVYADTKGNIGWYAAGRIPIRRKGTGELPYEGAGTDGDWTGFIPFGELPNLYNPPEGMIVTANQRIVGTDYKYQQMSRDAAAPWRARTIYDALKRRSRITMEDVAAVQFDDLNMPLLALAKEIAATDSASPKTVALMKEWDGRMRPDSQAALMANEIRMCLANRIAAENKPVSAAVIRERVLGRALMAKDAKWLPKDFKNYADLIRHCDTASRESMAAPTRFGPDETKWVWGSYFKSRFSHPLAAAPLIGARFASPSVGLNGSGQSPNVGSAVSMRHISSPGNWDATRFTIPLGQSGDPSSPHFKDQFEAWRTGASAVFPFTNPAVTKAAVSSIVYIGKQ